MELEHTLITAKAFFPDATILENERDKILYSVKAGMVLVVIHAELPVQENMSIPLYNCVINEFPKTKDDIWLRIEDLEEKQWIKILKKIYT